MAVESYKGTSSSHHRAKEVRYDLCLLLQQESILRFSLLVMVYVQSCFLSISEPVNVLYLFNQPFSYITDNPSWKCIAELHDTTLKTAKAGHTIHITCLGPLRVSYTGVLALAPLIHSRPPSFPPLSEILHERTSLEPNLEAPAGGWDLTLHLGAGGNGAVKLETIGHKTGYASGDVDGTLPPIVRTDLKGEVTVSEAELWERKRLDQGTSDKPNPGITRGYAEGYELFPEELKTEVDVDGLVRFLRETLGDEVCVHFFFIFCEGTSTDVLIGSALYPPLMQVTIYVTSFAMAHWPSLNGPYFILRPMPV